MGIRRRVRNYFANRKFLQCGANVYVEKPICLDFSSIVLGNNVHILKDARIQNVSGNASNKIIIGDDTGIQYRFSVLAGADIAIGKSVSIASDVFLSAGSHGTDAEQSTPYGCQRYTGMPIVIEDGARLGEKVIVISRGKRVTIGEKAIIGAGSVVTTNIPPFSIAVGNPAKVIKKWNFETHKWEGVCCKWEQKE